MGETMIKRFLKLLVDATQKIQSRYFQLPIAGQDEAIYRERVYCYELYHQLRNLLEADKQLAGYTLNGEIDKRAHPIINLSCIPDFLIHIPGKMDNLIIIEVKQVNANPEEIKKDYKKLSDFVSKIDYKLGVQLVFGNDEQGFSKFKKIYSDTPHPALLLFWHQQPDEPAKKIL